MRKMSGGRGGEGEEGGSRGGSSDAVKKFTIPSLKKVVPIELARGDHGGETCEGSRDRREQGFRVGD